MADFFSERFGKSVWVTNHARERMQRRNIDAATLQRVIEEGEIKRRDEVNLWVFAHIQGQEIARRQGERVKKINRTVRILKSCRVF